MEACVVGEPFNFDGIRERLHEVRRKVMRLSPNSALASEACGITYAIAGIRCGAEPVELCRVRACLLLARERLRRHAFDPASVSIIEPMASMSFLDENVADGAPVTEVHLRFRAWSEPACMGDSLRSPSSPIIQAEWGSAAASVSNATCRSHESSMKVESFETLCRDFLDNEKAKLLNASRARSQEVLECSPGSTRDACSTAALSTRESSPLFASNASSSSLPEDILGRVLDFDDAMLKPSVATAPPPSGLQSIVPAPGSTPIKGRKRAAVKAILARSLFCVRWEKHKSDT
mmetsp:Transcript_25334/g.40028  ORF Transcript_25334/g.40028 Transcript_25334/m.40028 type:complete len:291 (+) Transcript_25334:64-936(+)